MESIPSEFNTALKRGYLLQGKALVIAEWNYNNLFDVKVTNPPDDTNWILNKDYFTTKSIITGVRPKSGIFYAITDESVTDSSTLGLDEKRYYAIDEINTFKYWICPTPSTLDAADGEEDGFPDILDYTVDRGVLELDYGSFLNMNKLSVTFNLGPTPVDWSFFIFEQETNDWIEIAGPEINALTGVAELWWNGTAWVNTQQLDQDEYLKISKVKIEVRTIDSPQKRFQVVEVAGKREMDMTDRLEEYSMNLSMDNQTYLYPVGRMSANDGSIVFNNNDLKMNHEDSESDFYGALKGWCQYRTYIDYDLSDYGGASSYKTRTGTMYANDWQQTNEYQYQIELFDIFKILQSIPCPSLLIENQSIARIVATLLDMVGVDTYSFEFDDFDTTNNVKYFWTDGTAKVFDVLDDLCKSHQAALFVDELGLIRLLTRNDVTPEDDEIASWIFNGEDAGLDIPDIIKLNKKYDLQINKIKINYTRREAKTDDIDIRSQPNTSSVWEANETIVLRAAPLVRPMTADFDDPGAGLNDVWVNGSAAENWPFKGKVNIDGELIQYEGKGYAWWDHTTGSAVYQENLVMSNDDRKALDRKSYDSFKQAYTDTDPGSPTFGELIEITGGVSRDPTEQNRYTGRLRPIVRDFDQAGQQKAHPIAQGDGWYTMDFWPFRAESNFTDKYFTPGLATYNLSNLKDWVNKPGWGEAQVRATAQNSILTVDNTHANVSNPASHGTLVIKEMDDTEFREIGSRIRLRSGTTGVGMIAFYMSNATGYDNVSTPLTEAFYANRCYVVSLSTSEHCDLTNRSMNEVSIAVKNGDSFSLLPQMGFGNGGNIKIDADKWYDIDIVFRDGVGAVAEGGTASLWDGQTIIEVYVDGAFMDSWHTVDNIRPTALIGVGARERSIVDFEYVYATTTTSKGRIQYKDDDLFDAYMQQLESGTNITKIIEIPWDGDWNGSGVMTISTWNTAATIHSLELISVNGSNVVNLAGPSGLTVKPDQILHFEFNDFIQNAGRLKIKYTSVKDISIVVESTLVRNYPYGIDNAPVPPPSSYYDFLKGGYLSTKRDEMFFTPQRYFGLQFLSHEVAVPIFLGFFYDDFGAIAHEVRDFDVEYDVSPAKGVSIYSSNPKVKPIGYKYSPVRGFFSMVNVSHRDEIVNGSEEVDESNSIDHTLMLYGYVLEEKGDENEEVQNELSIKKYGIISEEIDADWIFTKDEAKSLADWIITHWGESMDTISLETFCSTHIQIGDKVHINYSNASIDPTWFYIITEKNIAFSVDGLEVSVTARRVR